MGEKQYSQELVLLLPLTRIRVSDRCTGIHIRAQQMRTPDFYLLVEIMRHLVHVGSMSGEHVRGALISPQRQLQDVVVRASRRSLVLVIMTI